MSRSVWVSLLLAVTVLLVGTMGAVSQDGQPTESAIEFPYYFSFGAGVIGYEGDEELEDGVILNARLGYDHNDTWGIEGSVYLAPSLDEGFHGYTFPDGPRMGETIQVSNVADPADAGFESTWSAGLSVDGICHFTRWDRLDPYLTLGVGFMFYGDKVNGESFDPAIRAGGGVMYHFNDEWAIRADGRTFMVGNDTEANAIFDAGIVWTWGARVKPDYEPIDGPRDSDGDGLLDTEEGEIGTDPYNPDTDQDRLQDGEEVKEYMTDPLNPDTDYDFLSDGAEVHDYSTDPKKADTDDGGVADGHEVVEDKTDPRAGHGDDDLILFELYIQFKYDDHAIPEAFFKQLDVIGKVLQRNTGSSARIEGHADKLKRSKADYNRRLSERRARSVMSYLNKRVGIAEGRLSAKGYGFDRPKAANDPVHGNPENRRVEIYIRGVTDKENLPTMPGPATH